MKKLKRRLQKEVWVFKCSKTGDYYLDSIGDHADDILHPLKYVTGRGWVKRPAKKVKIRLTITEIE